MRLLKMVAAAAICLGFSGLVQAKVHRFRCHTVESYYRDNMESQVGRDFMAGIIGGAGKHVCSDGNGNRYAMDMSMFGVGIEGVSHTAYGLACSAPEDYFRKKRHLAGLKLSYRCSEGCTGFPFLSAKLLSARS